MARGTGDIAGLPRRRRYRFLMAMVGAACLVLAGSAIGWAAGRFIPSTPSCSWPVRVRGKPTTAQAGLVRCYLRALAGRDTARLLAVAADIPAGRP